MSDDYKTTGRSDDDVRRLARSTRDHFEVAPGQPVDIIACLRSGHVKTVYGLKRLVFQILQDEELGADDGLTSYSDGVVSVAAKRSVLESAQYGEGRARMTLAHELAHAVMHNGAPKARRTLGNRTLAYIRPFESAEHQAKIFAPAFLIDESAASKLQSPEEIAVAFQVSLQSATILHKKFQEQKNRTGRALAIMKLREEFRASIRPAPKITYSQALCTHCGNPTLEPIGVRFLCHTCGSVSDQFQDGDPYP